MIFVVISPSCYLHLWFLLFFQSYGDKSPRSIPARLFAVVWITVGLVILAMFMGIVTTSLTASNLEGISNLYGQEVDVVYRVSPWKTSLTSVLMLNLMYAVNSINQPLLFCNIAVVKRQNLCQHDSFMNLIIKYVLLFVSIIYYQFLSHSWEQ